MIEWFKLNIHLFVSNFDLENLNIVSDVSESLSLTNTYVVTFSKETLAASKDSW